MPLIIQLRKPQNILRIRYSVFGQKVRKPSSYPPRETVRVYDEYLAEIVKNLQQLQTILGLNSIQRKIKSSDYYNKRINTHHFHKSEHVYLINNRNQKKHDKRI